MAAIAEHYPEIIFLNNDEFEQKIEKIMVIEALTGFLQDLTSEKIKFFKEAV